MRDWFGRVPGVSLRTLGKWGHDTYITHVTLFLKGHGDFRYQSKVAWIWGRFLVTVTIPNQPFQPENGTGIS